MPAPEQRQGPSRLDAVTGAGRTLLRGLPSLTPTLLIVGLLACVLVPLPTALVDVLLSLSLAGGVLLLVLALRVGRTSDVLGFPSMLLLATLYRLALNVSTTRLILSQADAGRVVDAFASFVVRGDLIVGAVMFLIITAVQYLVIARGAERVAEVSARFALDALPGHQRAIDQDLRSGAISATEAARRRARLTERSSFYGAMDGAIRFVKGDAIAGLAITGINLAGGLAIGVGRQGLGWTETLDLYGRLTIGDGLLAQIPALLVSLAAGLLVSRVDAEDEEGGGRKVLEGIDAPMLLVPAALLFLMAAVPGMPGLAFATVGLGFVTGALLMASRQPGSSTEHERRLVLMLPPELAEEDRGRRRLLERLRERCEDGLGLPVPRLRVQAEPSLAPDRYELRLGPRLLARGEVDAMSEGDALILQAYRGIMGAGPALVDLEHVDAEVERVRTRRPAVVREALEVARPRDLLAIIRAFARERVPAPPMEALLDALAEGERYRDAGRRGQWPEDLRRELSPLWLPGLLEAAEQLGPVRWVRPTPDFEEVLLERLDVTDGRAELRLRPEDLRRWREALLTPPAPEQTQEAPAAGAGPTLVLATARGRRAVAALLHGHTPHIPVLATAELEMMGVESPPRDQVRWVDVVE